MKVKSEIVLSRLSLSDKVRLFNMIRAFNQQLFQMLSKRENVGIKLTGAAHTVEMKNLSNSRSFDDEDADVSDCLWIEFTTFTGIDAYPTFEDLLTLHRMGINHPSYADYLRISTESVLHEVDVSSSDGNPELTGGNDDKAC